MSHFFHSVCPFHLFLSAGVVDFRKKKNVLKHAARPWVEAIKQYEECVVGKGLDSHYKG